MADTVERKFGARMPVGGAFPRAEAERLVRASVLRRARAAYPDLELELADVDVDEEPATPSQSAHVRGTLTVRVQLPPTGTVARG